MQTTETVALKVGEAQLILPVKTLVASFLQQALDGIGTAPKPTPAPVSTIPAVGEYWLGEGGINGGWFPGENGAPGYYLIWPTHPDASNSEIAFGSYSQNIEGAQSKYDGLANTRALVDSEHGHPAAEWADGLEIEGHNDFYLPAQRELSHGCIFVPQLFAKGWHWSSTQFSANYAWIQDFGDGNQDGLHKNYEYAARAVRRKVIQ